MPAALTNAHTAPPPAKPDAESPGAAFFLHHGSLVERLCAATPLKTAAFIVTIYGDIVEPRGGELWMGNLIEACAAVGLSETLVRTAVSRLVAAGQLAGERVGRRSYYRLTPDARAEFAYAANVLYEQADATGWRLIYLPGDAPEPAMRRLKRLGYAALDTRLAIGPEGSLALPADAVVWQANVCQGDAALRDFAAAYWNLPSYEAAYRGFCERFAPVAQMPMPLEPSLALVLRLLLVHQYRAIALRDPRLPAAALPSDWAGHQARQLFAGLYQRLSRDADRYIADRFTATSGALPQSSGDVSRRLERLGQVQ